MTDPAATQAALDEALDALEQVVWSQWVHWGEGWYHRPDTSTAEVVASVLVAHRPKRWVRTTSGLRWDPEVTGR